jgi:hypothetical protein
VKVSESLSPRDSVSETVFSVDISISQRTFGKFANFAIFGRVQDFKYRHVTS